MSIRCLYLAGPPADPVDPQELALRVQALRQLAGPWDVLVGLGVEDLSSPALERAHGVAPEHQLSSARSDHLIKERAGLRVGFWWGPGRDPVDPWRWSQGLDLVLAPRGPVAFAAPTLRLPLLSAPVSYGALSIQRGAAGPEVTIWARDFSRGAPLVSLDEDGKFSMTLGERQEAPMMHSTFISYGGPDEPFARRLHEALHGAGVETFFFAEHALPGEKLHRLMRRGVNEHDRVILICSQASLDRNGVLNEIEETLAREARDGGAAYLIPIRLDDYLFARWRPANPDVAQALKDRVVADFRGTDSDGAKFDAQLARLLSALRKRP
jgi:hypothetical protein